MQRRSLFNYSRMGTSNVCKCTRNIIQFTATWKLSLPLLLLLLRSTLAQLDIPTEFQFRTCGPGPGGLAFSKGSALEGNLEVVLNSLVDNVNKTGYNISWHGENGDKVYGLAQCRGDLNASACRACVSNATKTLRKPDSCGVHGSASINLNGCFVKYGTSDFYSQLDRTSSNICGRNRTSKDEWDPSIGSLLDKLTDEAVSSDVAFSTVNGTGFGFYVDTGDEIRIYGLAQCWRDLNTSLCRKCLDSGKQKLASCFKESEGLGFYQNCMIKYERYKFYGEYAGLLSSLKSAPIPASGPSRATNEGKSTRSLVLGLSIAGVVIVVFMFTVFVIWKTKVTRPFYKKSLPEVTWLQSILFMAI